jgi:hypothetical protein
MIKSFLKKITLAKASWSHVGEFINLCTCFENCWLFNNISLCSKHHCWLRNLKVRKCLHSKSNWSLQLLFKTFFTLVRYACLYTQCALAILILNKLKCVNKFCTQYQIQTKLLMYFMHRWMNRHFICNSHDCEHTHKQTKTNSVALSPRANYTDWATATCRRNLVPTFVDREVLHGERGGSPTVVNLSFLDQSHYFSFK